MNMKIDDDDRIIIKNSVSTQWPAVQCGKVNLIALILAGVVILAIAGAAYWFLFREDDDPLSSGSTAALPLPAHYLSFKDMVVNLVNDETYELHYMQLSVSVMTRKIKCLEQIKNNQPVILNALLEQLSSWKFQEVMIPEKREVLRKKLLETVHQTTGLSLIKGVEDVFITNMVIQ
ncbi:flagellar basal body-associated protein FliL [Endozoicomonas sp. SCSIO W0465]|uniref:flagellar basal body-associated FliL family protein n=1 Tax=Endozoicomonas sp. SCSIO W0465 TaxID=2918516 RepID=UPI0020750EB3|nr:flagellar basal body-associated FliL family protein [Endozoicomonas sp. SCSIO W0465]USE38280.1 flagellar basal body-associated FliL family protein [Endozoicomonas sp. SCSIO W0465]